MKNNNLCYSHSTNLDIFYLSKPNSHIQNKFSNEQNIDKLETTEFNNLLQDFVDNKKSIKNKINKLYGEYSDISNILTYEKANESKTNILFLTFLKSLIEDIKNKKINKLIQNELLEYNNINNVNNSNNINLENNINYEVIKDISINNSIMRKQNKNNNLNKFIEVNNKQIQKILPKKRI